MKEMSKTIKLINKHTIIQHISIIIIFLTLSIILTFPVIVNFASQAAGDGCYDKCHMMWRFWWSTYSFENGLDPSRTNYMFYPDGVQISGNLAQFTTSIAFLLLQFLDYTATWNAIWFLGFIFGGYGAFLLANHFNRNFFSSLVAGIIFTFSSYHMAQAYTHIGLSMIVWIPIFILFLFKILEKNSKVYAIGAGICFFLVSITHLYYSLFVLIFLIIFFGIYIFKEKKISNKAFVINFSIMITIGMIATLIVFAPILESASESYKRPLSQHMMFSVSIENLVMPTPLQTNQQHSDFALIKWFHSVFEKEVQEISTIEQLVFLGYSVIFLSFLALIKFRNKHFWFWVLISGVFLILSLGPDLKFFNQPIGFTLPEKVLYETLPGWDNFRAPARFIVMTTLAMAILSSYAISGLMKIQKLQNKSRYILVTVIVLVILFEFSTIPYPSYSEPIPEIYEKIKNDSGDFAILESPIGTTGDFMLMSLPKVIYYQTFHEKPIYGGYESRPSIDTLRTSQTYFLNMFLLFGEKNDIIKQDLKVHGLSLFDYFDIRYVILQKKLGDHVSSQIAYYSNQLFVPETRNLLSQILGSDTPFYEDDMVIAFKIPPKTSSKPFLLLGSGWYNFDLETQSRAISPHSEIIINNPSDAQVTTTLTIELRTTEDEKTVQISMNNENLAILEIPNSKIEIILEDIRLKPGQNFIFLDTEDFETRIDPESKIEYQFSLVGHSISLQPSHSME